MERRRELWIGRDESAKRQRLIELLAADRPALWIVPSLGSAEQILSSLTLRHQAIAAPRVWTWDELWNEIGRCASDSPRLLGGADCRAVLIEAIERARLSGKLGPAVTIANTAGFRRMLTSSFASWTHAAIHKPPRSPTDLDRVAWAIYRFYRKLLRDRSAKDSPGFARWAAGRLSADVPRSLRDLEWVVALDPPAGNRAVARALRACDASVSNVIVTLPIENDAGAADLFAPADRLRNRLIKWGFSKSTVGEDPLRPSGLGRIERGLFRDESGPPVDAIAGLLVRGAPRGGGVGLVVAKRVRDLLEEGCEPGDILVVVPAFDAQARLILEALESWGIECSSEYVNPLASDRPIATLRRALVLSFRDWEAEDVVRLLRNSQFRPTWPEVSDPRALAATASVIRTAKVFRGRAAIRSALERLRARSVSASTGDDSLRREGATAQVATALAIVDRLDALLVKAGSPHTFRERVEALRALADGLGLSTAGRERNSTDGLDGLFEALDDHADLLAELGHGADLSSGENFLGEFDRIVHEVSMPAAHVSVTAGVRVVTVGEARGMAARHVIFAGLEEGVFPSREAVSRVCAQNTKSSRKRSNDAVGREMQSFLGVVSSARESLTFVYPSADEKGQSLLRSGFLNDVRRLFTRAAWQIAHQAFRRLDPVLHREFCGAPADARLHAMDRALRTDPPDCAELKALASNQAHRPFLDHAAHGLRIAHERMRTRQFGPYDGRLVDPNILRKLARDFGGGRPAFTVKQLESLAFCPFQFFQRYVLHLEPSADHDELDEDRVARSVLLRRALADLPRELLDLDEADPATRADRVAEWLRTTVGTLHDQEIEPTDGVEAGLREIELRHVLRGVGRFAAQLTNYAAKEGASAVECHRVEVGFGRAGDVFPALTIGAGAESVQVTGRIDRIDRVEVGGHAQARVILYKMGTSPGKREHDQGLALQLPLYAMAVARLGIAGNDVDAKLPDLAYWRLEDKGFSRLKSSAPGGGIAADEHADWERFDSRFQKYVLELAAEMRHARFPVQPRRDDCTRVCEFSSVCRIKQVRTAAKEPSDTTPRLGPDE